MQLVYPVTFFKKADSSGYQANAVHFDGATYANRGGALTNAVNGKSALFSVWVRYTGGDDVDTRLIALRNNDSNQTNFLRKETTVNPFLEKSLCSSSVSGVSRLRLKTATTYNSAINPGWHHFLYSYNTLTGRRQVYVDDVSDLGTNTSSNVTQIFNSADCSIGAKTQGDFKVNMDVADPFLLLNVDIDISIEANRRKFINAAGKPVDLGPTGEAPGFGQPDILFAGPLVNWLDNRGDGGAFTITIGSITTAVTSPSD